MLFFLFIISPFQCKKDKESEIIIINQIDSLNKQTNKLFEKGKVEESLVIYKKIINKSQQGKQEPNTAFDYHIYKIF